MLYTQTLRLTRQRAGNYVRHSSINHIVNLFPEALVVLPKDVPLSCVVRAISTAGILNKRGGVCFEYLGTRFQLSHERHDQGARLGFIDRADGLLNGSRVTRERETCGTAILELISIVGTERCIVTVQDVGEVRYYNTKVSVLVRDRKVELVIER